ncbi:MAG: cytochrome C [Pseudomonadota bacterium]
MSKLYTMIALAGAMSAASFTGAFAQEGDAAAGEKTFKKRCSTCHIVGDVAEVSKKAGPNLTDIFGRKPGSREQFTKYGDSIVALGEKLPAWDEASLDEYIQNPRKYLRAKLEDKKAKSRMSFKLSGKKRADDRADIISYLKSLNPPKEGS